MPLSFVIAFFSSYAIGSLLGQRRCQTLADRMIFFRKSLIVSAIVLFAGSVLILVGLRQSADAVVAETVADLNKLLVEQANDQTSTVVAIIAILVLLMIQVISLVRDLHSFVAIQSADLKTRDQIALHESK
jgi:hypothetical protein